MREKIIEKKNIIILVASIVAGALLIPSFISLFSNNLNDIAIITLIAYGGYLATALLFIYYVCAKKEITLKALILPIIIFEAASALTSVYNLIVNSSWSSIFYIALYLSVIIVSLIYLGKKCDKLKYAIYILLLVCIAFNLASVFNGSTIGLSCLIINLVITGIFYLNSLGGNE